MLDGCRVQDQEFLNELAHDRETKTKRLIADVEEALDYLYLMWSRGGGNSSSQFQLHPLPPLDVSFCPDLLEHVRSIVLTIRTMAADHLGYKDSSVEIHVDSLYATVWSIQKYLLHYLTVENFLSRSSNR